MTHPDVAAFSAAKPGFAASAPAEQDAAGQAAVEHGAAENSAVKRGAAGPGAAEGATRPAVADTRAARPDVLPVLMYHSIGNSVSADFRTWEVPPGAFAEQLGALVENGYTLTGLSDALANPRERQIAVTFDDGFTDFVTRALPVLRELGAGATLYVPTAHVGRRADWLTDYAERDLPLLDWPELAALAEEGIEIGSHGHRHLELDVLPPALAHEDIAESMRVLTERIGRRPRSFCYPFGYHSLRVRAMVMAAGFSSACEVGYRLHRRSRSRFAVSRLIVDRSVDGPGMLRLVTEGQRGLAFTARRRLRVGWRAYRAARLRLGRDAQAGGMQPAGNDRIR